jgi:D-alanyl-D-alanine carboxypeptidase (penicillin-binding protein 5/6)
MKKKFIAVILTAAILTGCSNTPTILLTYLESNQDEYQYEQPENIDIAEFFATDLTVIPDDLNHMQNSDITATSSLIINTSDDEVLYANNVYQRLYPASLTKLITALVVLIQGDLNDTVTISYNASHITESGAKLCGFKEGDKVKLDALLNSLLVYSGNDAGIAIAEHIGGSEAGFSKLMNETAKSIGAVHSNFINAHGLHDDNHYTTAYDLYLIFNELLMYDKFVSIINQASYTIQYTDKDNHPKEVQFLNTNRYLKGLETAPEGITVTGGKTGTTSKAGNCLILHSKDSNNKSYVSLIMQASDGNSLFSQMTKLLNMIP